MLAVILRSESDERVPAKRVLLLAGNLIPRPALYIEDHAPLTRWADEPFALASVTESERAAANAAHGHRGTVARTDRRFTSAVRLANRALLVGVETCALLG